MQESQKTQNEKKDNSRHQKPFSDPGKLDYDDEKDAANALKEVNDNNKYLRLSRIRKKGIRSVAETNGRSWTRTPCCEIKGHGVTKVTKETRPKQKRRTSTVTNSKSKKCYSYAKRTIRIARHFPCFTYLSYLYALASSLLTFLSTRFGQPPFFGFYSPSRSLIQRKTPSPIFLRLFPSSSCSSSCYSSSSSKLTRRNQLLVFMLLLYSVAFLLIMLLANHIPISLPLATNTSLYHFFYTLASDTKHPSSQQVQLERLANSEYQNVQAAVNKCKQLLTLAAQGEHGYASAAANSALGHLRAASNIAGILYTLGDFDARKRALVELHLAKELSMVSDQQRNLSVSYQLQLKTSMGLQSIGKKPI